MLPHSDEAAAGSDSQAAMSPSLSPSTASSQPGSGNLLRALVNQGVIPTPLDSMTAMAQRAGRSPSSAAGAAAAAAGAAAAEAAAAAAVMPPPPPRERSVNGASTLTSTLIAPAIGLAPPLPTFTLGTVPGIGADLASTSSAAGSAVTAASGAADTRSAAHGQKLCKRELQEALTDAHDALSVSGNVAPRVSVAPEDASAGVVADTPASAACSQPASTAADGGDFTPCGYASEQ